MKGLFLGMFMFLCYTAFPQSVIQFDTKVHDFGSIKEVDGTVSYNFEFVNRGNAPILIKNVESSCGCTSPEWTRQPVLPGKTGYVKATFNPKDRPGFFDKTITVYSNARTAVVELKIRGTVEGKTRTVLDDYPYELPSGIRMPLEEISLMKARKGETKTGNIPILNNAGKQIMVRFADVPAHIRISMEPQQVANRANATIKASYNTALHGEYGLNREDVTMIVDGQKYQLPVSVYVEEDFKGVDPTTAPAIEVDKKYYNFGQTAASQVASFSYQIKNTGKAPLKIRRIYGNDGRITAEVAKKELQPGETASVVVKTVSGAEKGKMTAVVSVISNSPATPELKIRFYGEIK